MGRLARHGFRIAQLHSSSKALGHCSSRGTGAGSFYRAGSMNADRRNRTWVEGPERATFGSQTWSFQAFQRHKATSDGAPKQFWKLKQTQRQSWQGAGQNVQQTTKRLCPRHAWCLRDEVAVQQQHQLATSLLEEEAWCSRTSP